ncbi:hypothetical protein [Virgibacillus sp. FSP13]
MSNILKVVSPKYVYIKLKPNNSIRNNNTHLIARTIASLYKSLWHSVRKEDEKTYKLLGKELFIGTKWSFERQGKIAYYIYIEKEKVEFYFIIPEQHLSIMKEKLGDVWGNITVEEVAEIPSFDEKSIKKQLIYEKEDPLSLRIDRRDNDLLESNLNVIDVLEEGDKAGILYNFIPMPQGSFRHSHRYTMEKVKNSQPVDRDKTGTAFIFKYVISLIDSLLQSVSDALVGEKKNNKESALESIVDRLNGGQKVSDHTENKVHSTILNTQILVMSESKERIRERNNAKSLVQSFDMLSDDNRLVSKNFKGKINIQSKNISGAAVNKMSDSEVQNFISLAGKSILEKYPFVDKVETQETTVPEDLRKGTMRIGVNTFRGIKQPAYLSVDKEFRYLSLILIGPNRSGKSTLIGNLSYDSIQNDECTIIFDYIGNCELSEEVSDLYPDDRVLNIECDDFEKLQGLGYNEAGFDPDPFKQYDNAKKQTTQLMTLINSINTSETHLSPKMERYLVAASLVTFINNGSIRDVFQVLQDHETRHAFLDDIPKEQVDNLKEYMQSLDELDDYNKEGMIVGTKLSLIVGIIDRLNKLKANTYMELMLKKSTENNIDLVEEMQISQLICIKMPEHMFTTDNEKDVYSTYWITKIWMALQIRKSMYKREEMKKVNLVIDELYQVQTTEKFLTTKLSRLPKFNIKPIISCHYLNQIKHIREELRSASASYMLISGCDKQNYSELKDELYPFDLDDLLKLKRYHSLNLIKNKEGYGRFITRLPKPITNERMVEDEGNKGEDERYEGNTDEGSREQA